jgi:hypothetical protein
MPRTGIPAQPKFDHQLAWLKRLAALAGLYASGAPVVLALWRMFFGKACCERGGEREARNQSARTPVDTRFGSPRMRRVSHDGNGTKPGREGTYLGPESSIAIGATRMEATMNGLIYLVGLVVVIMFILSFLGLR